MATSDVAICNRALHKLGAGTIISLSDNKEKARVMNVAFEPVRRAEIRRRRWRFAIKRTSLPALSSAPDSDYDFQYQLPNDYLRIIEGGALTNPADLTDYRASSSAIYSIEGGVLLTNIGAPLPIRYLADITDASLFDSCFVETLACRLALETVTRITESSAKEDRLRADYRQSIHEAVRANAFEVAAESSADAEWVIARTQ